MFYENVVTHLKWALFERKKAVNNLKTALDSFLNMLAYALAIFTKQTGHVFGAFAAGSCSSPVAAPVCNWDLQQFDVVSVPWAFHSSRTPRHQMMGYEIDS